MTKSRFAAPIYVALLAVLCVALLPHLANAQQPQQQLKFVTDGQTFDSLGEAESHLRSLSSEHSLLVKKNTTSDGYQKTHHYEIAPQLPTFQSYTYVLCFAPGAGGGLFPCGPQDQNGDPISSYSSEGAAVADIVPRFNSNNACASEPPYVNLSGDTWLYTTGPASDYSLGGYKEFRVQREGPPGCPSDTNIQLKRSRDASCDQPGFTLSSTAPSNGEVYCSNNLTATIWEYDVYFDHCEQETYGNPCDPATGIKTQKFHDYSAPGIDFYRTYRSRMPAEVATGGCGYLDCAQMPAGWTHSYAMRPILEGQLFHGNIWRPEVRQNNYLADGNLVGLLRPDGSLVPFSSGRARDGSGIRMVLENVELTPGRFVNVYTAYLADGSKEVYETVGFPSDECDHFTSYRLARVVDAVGRVTTVNYESDVCGLRAESVSNQFGHQVDLQYTDTQAGAKYLTSITAHNVNTTLTLSADESQYIEFNALSGDTLLSYTSTGYTGLLDILTDADGKQSDFDYDEFGRAIGTKTGVPGEYYNQWSFDYSDDNFRTVTITDGNGNDRELRLAGIAGPWQSIGRVTQGGEYRRISYTSSHSHLVSEKVDERGVKTRYEYANVGFDRLEKKTIGDGVDERVYEYEYLNTMSSLRTRTRELSVCQDDGASPEPVDPNDPGGATFIPPRYHTTEVGYEPGTQIVNAVIESGYVENEQGTCDAISRTTAFSNFTSFGMPRNIDGPRPASNGINDDIVLTYYDCTSGGACGQIHTVTNSEGHVWTFDTYNSNGRATKITQPNGVSIEYVYGNEQRLESMKVNARTGAAVQTTTYEYYPNGLLKKVTDPTNVAFEYNYNAGKLLSEIIAPDLTKVVYEYDPAGNQTDVFYIEADGTTERYHKRMLYDARNNHTGDQYFHAPGTGSNYSEWTWVNDAVGLAQSATAPYAHVTTFDSYDDFENLLSLTDAEQGVTFFDYDVQDNLRSVTAPNSAETTYVYDDFGRVVREYSPDRGVTRYTYDRADNLLTTTADNGLVTTYTYDGINRVKKIEKEIDRLDTSIPGTEELTFVYDANASEKGRLSEAKLLYTSSGSPMEMLAYEYDYDNFGRRSKETMTTYGGWLPDTAVSYTYDGANRVKTIQHDVGTNVNVLSYEYGYDSVGRVLDIDNTTVASTTASIVSNVGYAPFGPHESLTHGNGATLDRQLDHQYRIDKLTTDFTTAISLLYDPTWRDDYVVSALTDSVAGKLHTFYYDDLYRLIYEDDQNRKIYYDYDANGNRTELKERDYYDNELNDLLAYRYEVDSNRLFELEDQMPNGAPIQNPIVDSAGVMTDTQGVTGMQTRFEIDSDNRLRTALEGSSSTSMSAILAFDDYNHLGQRAIKEHGGAIDQASRRHSMFTYGANGELLGEVVFTESSTGSWTMSHHSAYVWMDDTPVAQIVTAFDSAGVVANDDTYYIHTDHLNRPIRATNDQQEVVFSFQTRSAFGVGYAAYPYPSTPNSASMLADARLNLRFPGQYYDFETGLSYNYYRTYDPSTGRYLESDPIGLNGGLNTYGYVGSSPTASIDPLGLEMRLGRSYAFGGAFYGAGNHVFIYSTESGRAVGRDGAYGVANGPGFPENYRELPFVTLPVPYGQTEQEFMACIEDYEGWNRGSYFPGIDDCQTQAKEALEHCGLADPPNWPLGRLNTDERADAVFSGWRKNLARRFVFRILRRSME